MTAFDHALSNPPNANDPTLADTMVDPMLSQTRNLAAEWLGFGEAARYPDNSVHRIKAISVQIKGDQATVLACDVDDGILYQVASKVLNDAVTTARDQASLTLVDGTWKLGSRTQLQKWNGVAGCAVSSS